MGYSVFPAVTVASGKVMYRTTLTSGTSYTVPTGVTYLNVTLVGAGGGGAGGVNSNSNYGRPGHGGQVVHSTLTATAGASITYAIGAGGAGTSGQGTGGTGGTTTFTGATSANGGQGGSSYSGTSGTSGLSATNGGNGTGFDTTRSGGAGGNGYIIVEYWV